MGQGAPTIWTFCATPLCVFSFGAIIWTLVVDGAFKAFRTGIAMQIPMPTMMAMQTQTQQQIMTQGTIRPIQVQSCTERTEKVASEG